MLARDVISVRENVPDVRQSDLGLQNNHAVPHGMGTALKFAICLAFITER